MRKISIALCLFLCLFLAAPALAAPCRDDRSAVEADAALETAVSLFGGAALMRDVYALTEGETVPQALAEGVLLLGFGRGLLPSLDNNPVDELETADEAALNAMLAQLFMSNAVVPQTPSCPCITRDGALLSFDLTDVDVETAGGAYIFSVQSDNGRITVLADLYSAIDYFGEEIDLIPEDCLVWVRTAQFVLERDASALLGYRLVSMSTYPDWLDGALNEWELTLGEDYEVNLPAFFQLESSEDGTDTYTADGLDARLTIQTLTVSGEDPLAAARAEYAAKHPDAAILMEPVLYHFTAETYGAYVMYVYPEGAEAMRIITLTFPEERQYEFSFYGEIIRNSFWCEGIGLG